MFANAVTIECIKIIEQIALPLAKCDLLASIFAFSQATEVLNEGGDLWPLTISVGERLR